MRKIGNKDFQLSPQEAQFQEDRKILTKHLKIVLFSQEFLIQHR